MENNQSSPQEQPTDHRLPRPALWAGAAVVAAGIILSPTGEAQAAPSDQSQETSAPAGEYGSHSHSLGSPDLQLAGDRQPLPHPGAALPGNGQTGSGQSSENQTPPEQNNQNSPATGSTSPQRQPLPKPATTLAGNTGSSSSESQKPANSSWTPLPKPSTVLAGNPNTNSNNQPPVTPGNQTPANTGGQPPAQAPSETAGSGNDPQTTTGETHSPTGPDPTDPNKAPVPTPELLNAAQMKIINSLAITPQQKVFLTQMMSAALDMRRKGDKVSPEGMVAQAIHESGWNRSELSSKYHNYFGMKKKANSLQDPSVNLPTKEEVNGQLVSTTADFVIFDSVEAGLQYYYDRMVNGLDRYRPAENFVNDPAGYIHAIRAGGWATDTRYESEVMAYVNDCRLRDIVAAAS
jgi:flagellum-specific peptidoglycan hydrolase FlgJ